MSNPIFYDLKDSGENIDNTLNNIINVLKNSSNTNKYLKLTTPNDGAALLKIEAMDVEQSGDASVDIDDNAIVVGDGGGWLKQIPIQYEISFNEEDSHCLTINDIYGSFVINGRNLSNEIQYYFQIKDNAEIIFENNANLHLQGESQFALNDFKIVADNTGIGFTYGGETVKFTIEELRYLKRCLIIE